MITASPPLGPDDDVVAHLGHVPRRIAVAGVSGAGKTSWARRIGAALDLPHHEVDSLFHGPGWTPRPEFLDDVTTFLATDRWTCEYQYRQARPLISARAEVVLWLDLPVRVAMRQVTRRTWRRWRTREVLWNGNVEPRFFSTLDPDHNVVMWSWRSRRSLHDLPERFTTEAPGTVLVRVGSHAEAARWLRQIAGP